MITVRDAVQQERAATAAPPRQLARGMDGYPRALLDLQSPPAALWLRGEGELERRWVAVVGSRNADGAGLAAAEELAATLVAHGLGVLSGGALGIDGAAHQGALDAGGVTAAVMAGGVDRPTPARHDALFRRMLASAGLLLGEWPPGTPIRRGAFPRRNQLIAALARATLVVQARPASGTLLTAAAARALGRPLLVVPGGWRDGRRAGCNELLAAGAWPVASPTDLERALGALGLQAAPPGPSRPEACAAAACDADPVLAALAGGPLGVELLAARSGLPTSRLLARLTELELGGAVRALGGGLFVARR